MRPMFSLARLINNFLPLPPFFFYWFVLSSFNNYLKWKFIFFFLIIAFLQLFATDTLLCFTTNMFNENGFIWYRSNGVNKFHNTSSNCCFYKVMQIESWKLFIWYPGPLQAMWRTALLLLFCCFISWLSRKSRVGSCKSTLL